MSHPPLSIETIDAYLSGALDDDEAFEDALFDSIGRGDVVASEFFSLRRGIVEFVRRGTFDVVITAAEVAAIRSSGLRTTMVDAPIGRDSAVGEVDNSAEILLIRVELPLESVSRLDVEMLSGTTLVKTLDAARFDRHEGAIYFACEADLARTAGASGARHRFVAVEGGERRVLREIGFDEVVVSGS
ncbi:MAG: hypothetical protein H5U40_15940 [Polyangiaceae bacterium]|nr:hypothetical protein [Polyangiaceae bacterium]